MPEKHAEMYIQNVGADAVTELNTGNPSPVKVPTFTLASVPTAASWTGHLIIISDATPQALCYSDGTNWIATDDGTTAA